MIKLIFFFISLLSGRRFASMHTKIAEEKKLRKEVFTVATLLTDKTNQSGDNATTAKSQEVDHFY